jgi:putative protein-disulfide isomerase
MNKKKLIFVLLLSINSAFYWAQHKNSMKEKSTMLCNPDSGMCEIPTNTSAETQEIKTTPSKKALKIIYFTDPICSSCWGIEPQLRKLKLEYGANFDIEYKMGGLLPDWSYNSGGISKPSDVAKHWDEVSRYYDMPIDGDVWLEDPLSSSYPPSIAFKAAQIQDNQKAIQFLRELREMVFLQKKNITKWENIENAAKKVGLNTTQLKNDFENKAKNLFNEDLSLAKTMGVRGFPTIFIISSANNSEIVYGSKPYEVYENAILKLLPKAEKNNYSKQINDVLKTYNSLTLKECSDLTETPKNTSEQMLNELTQKNILEKHTTKNGNIWKLKE